MIIKKPTDENLVTESYGDDVTSYEAGFSTENEEFLFSMLSNLYKDSITSIIREVTSNCFDSHVEAGVKDPVQIRILNDYGKYYIEFEDVGVGLSPHRINTVFRLYNSSTKRNSNNQIGGWGLGSKSPLSYYTRSFNIITNYDNVNYHYQMYFRVGKRPVIDLLSSETTDKRNGTIIKIQIASVDLSKWKKALKTTLSYFDNIIYNNECDINNDFVVYETDEFKFSPNQAYSTKIHMLLGRVCYPIDFDIIDIEKTKLISVDLPIAIKFDIGEIMVVPSREDIDYNNSETIKTIIKKINSICDKINKIYQEQNPVVVTEDFQKYLKERNYSQNNYIFIGNHQLNISAAVSSEKRNKKRLFYKDFLENNIEYNENFSNEIYTNISSLHKQKIKCKNYGYITYKQSLNYSHAVYFLDEERSKAKDKYLLWLHKNKTISFFRHTKYSFIPKKGENSIVGITDRNYLIESLNLLGSIGTTKKIEKTIKIYQKLIKIPLYSELDPLNDFYYNEHILNNKKEKIKLEVTKEEVYLNQLTGVSDYNYKLNATIDKKVINLGEWRKTVEKANITVYGLREDKEKLIEIFDFFSLLLPFKKLKHYSKGKKRNSINFFDFHYNFNVVYVAQNYINKITKNNNKIILRNMFDVNNFPVRHPVVAKICTATFIKKTKLYRLCEYQQKKRKDTSLTFLDMISIPYTTKLEILLDKIKYINSISLDNPFQAEIYNTVVNNKFFDKELYNLYEDCCSFFDKISLIYSTIDSKNFEDEIFPILIEEMRRKKIRVAPKYIQLKEPVFNLPITPPTHQLESPVVDRPLKFGKEIPLDLIPQYII